MTRIRCVMSHWTKKNGVSINVLHENIEAVKFKKELKALFKHHDVYVNFLADDINIKPCRLPSLFRKQSKHATITGRELYYVLGKLDETQLYAKMMMMKISNEPYPTFPDLFGLTSRQVNAYLTKMEKRYE